MSTLNSTLNKQLLKSKRVSISIRLLDEDYAELKDAANEQQRSMNFVAIRRYLTGRNQELSNSKSYIKNSSITP